jgi:predicted peroxiredoxin
MTGSARRRLVPLTAVLTLLIGLAIALGGVAAIAQEEPAPSRGLLVNLTTDDTWTANMAIGLATTAAGEGVETVLFLNVRGVYLADAERLPDTAGNSEMDIHGRLGMLMQAGGEVIVCPMCGMEAGLTAEDLIDGVTMGEPGGVLAYLTDPDFTVISY